MVAAVTLLPAFLGLAGHKINRYGIHRKGTVPGTVGTGWQRWGRHVSKHAWPYAIGVTAVLVALTLPVFALQLGFPDEGTQPDSRTERRAYDLVADGFGPETTSPAIAASVALKGAEVFVDLAELIDVAAEIAKQEKELAKLDSLIQSKQKKLSARHTTGLTKRTVGPIANVLCRLSSGVINA